MAKIGLFMFSAPHSAPPAQVATKAEESGFESFWLPEHPVVPVHYQTHYSWTADGKIPEHFTFMPDPFIGLASAASVTKRIKLATGICLVPGRNPILLAKEIATLDQYSGGRVIIGAGAGWLREESEVLGTDFPSRWRRLRESVEAMRAMWTQEEAEFHGESIKFPPVRLLPHPIQQPYPPVLLGTYAYDERSLRRVARWADGWCPPALSPQQLQSALGVLTKLTNAAGRDPATLDITVLLGINEGSPCRDLIRQYEDVGAQRVVLMLGSGNAHASISPHFFTAEEVDSTLEGLAEKIF
jgi:probable F420-dependent oxidoreductase